MDENIIFTIIKSFSINILSILIFLRINDYKNMTILKKFGFVVMFFCFTLFYVLLRNYLSSIIVIIILCLVQSVLLSIVTSNRLLNTLVSVIISLSISYFFYIVSGIIEFIFQKILNIDNNIINLILISIIEFIILFIFFKIKKFRNGFSFLKNINEYVNLIIISISILIIYVYYIIGNYNNIKIIDILIMFSFLGVFMVITIKKSFSLQYKQNLLNKTIADYESEIKSKDEVINKLSEEKFRISKLNHEFYNRQKALETKIKEMSLEVGEELSVLGRVNDLTAEYSNELQKIKSISKLSLTNIDVIDDMFKYMQSECIKNNIDFKLQVSGNIFYLVNNIISKSKLETLIGDHIKNAIIAINSSNCTYKSILVILGIKDNCYEFCVYDSGINFEIETLIKLGLESVTTHKNEGGSGIGYITTFEILKECGASIIIEEFTYKKDSYTKCVKIKFDNKNEYKILSYRIDELQKNNKNNRIIIEDIC